MSTTIDEKGAAVASTPKQGPNREPLPGHKVDDGPFRDRNHPGDQGIYPPGTLVPVQPEYANPTVEQALLSKEETFGCWTRVGMLTPEEYNTPAGKFEGKVKSYHAHHYFDGSDPASAREALTLRQRAMDEFPNITVNRPHRDPIGPHPTGMWELELHTPAQFAAYLTWLVTNHGSLTALVHPSTDNGLLDHTVNCYWIGDTDRIATIKAGVENRMKKLMAKAREAKKHPAELVTKEQEAAKAKTASKL